MGITPTAIVLFINDSGIRSTIQIADYFDIDVKTVTYHIVNLRKAGHVERVGMVTTHGLTNNRNGKLVTTSRNCATYKVTTKFLNFITDNNDV